MRNFQRTIEDFICEHCGAKIKGNGYTNHCPQCLCSKHVDINPGDRAADCGGLMLPYDFEIKNGEYILIHRCEKCGFIRKNKFLSDDNFSVILELSKRKAERLKG